MIKIITIVGARPQIIKAAAISRAINNFFPDDFEEIIIHTGQHYDKGMSQVFFDELNIPRPKYNLHIGSGLHGKQTGVMIERLESLFLTESPDYILLYGDTNSTLAGAVAASKIHIPIIHIEAGLRSYIKSMPEEINRIFCDHCSTLLFSPTLTGYNNLRKEGFSSENKEPFNIDNPGIYHCGDIMYDNAIFYSSLSDSKSMIMDELRLRKDKFVLCTIHRDHNTDNPESLNNIFSALKLVLNKYIDLEIVLPLHPRTKNKLENIDGDLYNKLKLNERIRFIKPVSFLDMIALEKNSLLVMTDSGGVQKEAYFHKKPCVIFRNQTEWVEIVNLGNAILVSDNKEKICTAFDCFYSKKSLDYPQIFGDGLASKFILKEIRKNYIATRDL